MFTGLITNVGRILLVETRGDLRARIATNYSADSMDFGASIACDGICLTVVNKGYEEAPDPFDAWFDVDVSAETVSRTNLAAWQTGKSVNLERSLKVGDELGGHIVSGHVDGTAKVISVVEDGDSTRVAFDAPQHLARFIAEKGSVALNGTSLTVNDVEGSRFGVNFIPHTKAHTTWGDVAEGDMANLEIDTMARYVARLNEMAQT